MKPGDFWNVGPEEPAHPPDDFWLGVGVGIAGLLFAALVIVPMVAWLVGSTWN